MEERVNALVKELEHLKAIRSPWEKDWRTIGDLVLSRRSGGFSDPSINNGPRNGTTRYDSTANRALGIFSAGLHSSLTSPAFYWFDLEPPEELKLDHDVALWIDTAVNIMHAAMNDPAAQFHSAANEFYHDLGAFGTGVITVEDRQTSILFRSHYLFECYVAENADGLVDTLFRVFRWTAYQIDQQYGRKAALPKIVAEALLNEPRKPFTVIHVMRPAREFTPGNRGKAYESIVFMEEGGHVLEESGFDDQAFFATRWDRESGEVYGYGPGHVAKPDLLAVNAAAKDMLTAVQKAVDPPVEAEHDAFVNAVSLNPGYITYRKSGSTGPAISAIHTNADIPAGNDLIERRQKAIWLAFFADIFQTFGAETPGGQNPYMTAYETQQRKEEKMLLVGPMITRLQTEFLKPVLNRTFKILLRNGRIPPPPDVLTQNGKLRVNFTGPLSQALRVSPMNNVQRWIGGLIPLADREPGVMDVLDSEAYGRQTAEWHNVAASVVRSPEKVAKIRTDRTALQQQQFALQADASLASSMKDASVAAKNQGMA